VTCYLGTKIYQEFECVTCT